MLAPADLARTIILGNSGSGKSWLAERLAQQLGSRAIDLDEIHWLPGGFNARRDSAEARASVRDHAAQDRWIIEGVYGWLAIEALSRATSIVLIDIADADCVANVQARGVRRGGDEAAHAALIEWIKDYRVRQNANAFAAHLAIFDGFPGPKVRLSSRADLAAQVEAAAKVRTPVVIVPYDPAWPRDFELIRSRVSAALGTDALGVEHVGSTSVPGLAAKPIIDLDVVIASEAHLPSAISKLATIGYGYQGELGIVGRHAFSRPDGLPQHHLYVCAIGNPELERHLAFRDHLRANDSDAQAYAALKRELADRFGSDRDGYSQAKTAFVEEVLRKAAVRPAG